MSYKKCDSKKAGSKKSNEPRLLGSIVEEMLHGNSPLAVGYRQYIASQENGEAEEHGWHPNTHLGVDVKTLLRSDARMVVDKDYWGVFRLDSESIADEFLCRDPHFTFIEAEPQKGGKRNPHVFDGQYITVTRRGDGTLRLNFKALKVGKDFSVAGYAVGVANELLWGLEGLVEK